jgi:hypothetical protein
MKELKTKDQMLRYLKTFKPPSSLIQGRIKAVRFDTDKQEWTWAEGEIKGYSLNIIRMLIDEMEKYYGIDN